MKTSLSGGLPQRLGDAAVFVLKVARSPQLYIDSGWTACRAYLFSVIFISLLLSKAFHIFFHLESLTLFSLLGWGPTFFFTDLVLILLARCLARSYEWRATRTVAAIATVLLSLYTSAMTSANISYSVNMGSEIRWRKSSGFHTKNPSAKLVLSAIAVAFLTQGAILVSAYFATPHLSRATGAFLRLWAAVLSAAVGYFRKKKETLPDPAIYEQIAIDDYDGDDSDSVALLDAPGTLPEQKQKSSPSLVKRVIVLVSTLLYLFLRGIRPSDMLYSFLSASLPLAPFAGIFSPAPQGVLASLPGLPGDFSWLEGRTALDTFPKFEWLAEGGSPDAFPDWSPFLFEHLNGTADKEYLHYNPAKDPLHIPNLQNDLLNSIREVLHKGDVKIKHVILVKLESNRQDVFPFRSDSYIMKHIKESFDGNIPDEVMEKLGNLTPTAERLTGFSTGFESKTPRPKPYGGISAKKAYTSGTYTMKSITGTMCGVNPIAAQKNHEYSHDIYQPCLPRIFEALNHQANISTESEDWKNWPWHAKWMQSHYGTYDHQELLTPHMGFKDITTKESINEDGAKYIPEEPEEEKKWGHPDKTLKLYIRDAFEEAKKNNNRLFIAHLTHNTHTPYFKPGEYDQLFGNDLGWNEKINRYLNTIRYQDEWLADLLNLIEEAGVADETLLVMAGDHGLSLPNDGGITANHDPHVASFHVPLFLAHPKLPPVTVDSAVLSTQILPSILDILIESNSVNDGSMKVLKDLLPLYEGQSLLRPLIPEQGNKQEWHFSTMNPGGTWISMRAAAQPYRLVVPLIPDAPWRFTDVVADEFELSPEEDTDIAALFETVQARHGIAAAKWLSEAAHISQWWIAENHRRWGFNPEEAKEIPE
ncbi:hypothetical protein N7535_003822 [Penicillium sp. DV-2018c]|nr:hypothetical protein N7535_003822 [Penicillium sp. DV-2018c]